MQDLDPLNLVTMESSLEMSLIANIFLLNPGPFAVEALKTASAAGNSYNSTFIDANIRILSRAKAQ